MTVLPLRDQAMSLVHRFWSVDYSLTALLLCLCLNIFVVQPLGIHATGGRLVASLLFSLILLSGVGAVAHGAVTAVFMGGVVVASLAVHWLRFSFRSAALVSWDALASSLFCIVLALVVLAQVFREGPITLHRIQGAVAVYLLIGLAFTFAYELIELRWPHAFILPDQGMNVDEDFTPRFVYFSLVTLTTTGYGDITAVHPVARSLVTMEALTGQLFPAILLARLVSMELFYRQATDAQRR